MTMCTTALLMCAEYKQQKNTITRKRVLLLNNSGRKFQKLKELEAIRKKHDYVCDF